VGGEEERRSTWTMTYPSGERVRFTTGQPPEDLKPVMVCQASDPETSQVGVKCVKFCMLVCLYSDLYVHILWYCLLFT